MKCSRTFIEKSKLRQHLSSHGFDEVTINQLLVTIPPHASTNISELNPAENSLTSCALISSVSGDCSINEDKQIDINQSFLKENNQLFSTSNTCSTKAGSGKPAQLIQQLSSVNKVVDLGSECEKPCAKINEELSSQLSSCNAITNSSSISNIMTRSKAKHSKARIKCNDLKKKEVGFVGTIQEIRTVQNSCVLLEELTKSSTSNRLLNYYLL